jgi:seryl-tRNA synthetase
MTHPSAPIGTDDHANLEIARGSTPIPSFDFKAKDHLELGAIHDMIDFEAGARVLELAFTFSSGMRYCWSWHCSSLLWRI